MSAASSGSNNGHFKVSNGNGPSTSSISGQPNYPNLSRCISTWQWCIHLIINTCICGIALWLFTTGFLLTRREMTSFSQCSSPPSSSSSPQTSHNNNNGCWYPRQYDRAIIMVVDALRFDFAFYDPTLTNNDGSTNSNDDNGNGIGSRSIPMYRNKLPVLFDHLRDEPSKSRLFQFVADPPTTTMQRLKGLTTGGLPTFIDIKNNFASSLVEEDNILEQMVRNGHHTTFMGDDTWMALFPNHFNRSYPFPSFNVKDLHTVDNGCIQHLIPSMRSSSSETSSKEWDVIIAHFLGVDHVGHRYGPSHPSIIDKLGQMNTVITNVIHEMNDISSRTGDNIILFILGDHGMTPGGDHGGASIEETHAALFVYSTKPTFETDERLAPLDVGTPLVPKGSSSQQSSSIYSPLYHLRTELRPSLAGGAGSSLSSSPYQQFAIVPQIDLVPSISLLLGLPIPYGNLGSVIPELFIGTSSSHEESFAGLWSLLDALYVNAAQIMTYLHQYNLVARTFPVATLDALDRDHKVANDAYHILKHNMNNNIASVQHNELVVVINQYRQLLSSTSSMAREKWTTFDLRLMILGISLLVCVTIGIAIRLLHSRIGVRPRYTTTIATPPPLPPSRRLYSFMGGAWLNRSNLATVVVGGFFGIPACAIASTFGIFEWLPHDDAVIHTDVVREPLDAMTGLLYSIAFGVSLTSTMEALWSFIAGITLWYKRRTSTSGHSNVAMSASSDYGNIGDTREAIFSAFCYISYAQGLFSNSFIIHESHLLLFLATTLAILRAARVVAFSGDSPSVTTGVTVSLPSRIWSMIGLTPAAKWALVMGICLRYFGDGFGVAPFTSIYDMNAMEYISLIISLIFLPSMLYRSLQSTKKSTTWLFRTGIVTGFIICLSLVVIYWIFFASGPPSSGNVSSWPSLWIPRIVYVACTLGGIWVVLVKPLQTSPSDWTHRDESPLASSSSSFAGGGGGNEALRARRAFHVPSPTSTIHHGNPSYSYNEPMTPPSTTSSNFGSTPTINSSYSSMMIADDMASSLTAKTQAMFGMITLPMMLVLGPRSPTLGATMVMLIGALHWSRIKETTGKPPLLGATEVMIMWLATCRLWFATGHTNDISSLPAATAFVGFDEFNYDIGGTLLAINAFNPHIMAAVLLPMLMGWRARQMASSLLATSSPSSSSGTSPSSFTTTYSTTYNSMRRVIDGWHHDAQYAITLFVFLFIARATLSSVNAMIQRRHLMVWAIFAPKFVFDAAAMIVTATLFILPSIAITRYWRL
jgi:predicted AlkP superfamily pyrophosphatase or phosphodiesterase